MKKTITLLLTLGLLLGLLPVEAAAYLGDIRPVNSDTVTTKRCPRPRRRTAPTPQTGRCRIVILLHLRAPDITSGISCIPPNSA